MSRERGVGADWSVLPADRFEAWHVRALLDQKAACVVVPNFLPPDWCQEVTRRFEKYLQQHPERRIRLRPAPEIDVSIDTVTLPLDLFASVHPLNLDRYFEAVPRDQEELRAIYAGGPDPLALIRESWRSDEWSEVQVHENGRPFQTDVLWRFVGRFDGKPHVDTTHLLLNGGLSRFTNRLNFTAFVETPVQGGGFRFYRLHRLTDGFSEDGLKDVEAVEYRPKLGDLVVHDASSYFQILSMADAQGWTTSYWSAGLDVPAREFCLFL